MPQDEMLLIKVDTLKFLYIPKGTRKTRGLAAVIQKSHFPPQYIDHNPPDLLEISICSPTNLERVAMGEPVADIEVLGRYDLPDEVADMVKTKAHTDKLYPIVERALSEYLPDLDDEI